MTMETNEELPLYQIGRGSSSPEPWIVDQGFLPNHYDAVDSVAHSPVTEVGSKVNDFAEKKLAEANTSLNSNNVSDVDTQSSTKFGKSEMSHEVTIEIPGVEEATEAGNPERVGILGHSGSAGSVAAALVNQATKVSEPHKHISIPLPSNLMESNAQRKRRLAQKHNESINHNKILVVKLRTKGLGIRLEVLRMSNREINLNKERGIFAVYTVNSAVAASSINRLPFSQYKGASIINHITLDWLLDQLGETDAFEIRSGRLNTQTGKTKFVVTKSEEEWLAKGFYVVGGEVKIA